MRSRRWPSSRTAWRSRHCSSTAITARFAEGCPVDLTTDVTVAAHFVRIVARHVVNVVLLERQEALHTSPAGVSVAGDGRALPLYSRLVLYRRR